MNGDAGLSERCSDILNGRSEGLNRFKKTNAALPSKTGKIGENNCVFTMNAHTIACSQNHTSHTWDVSCNNETWTWKDATGHDVVSRAFLSPR